MLQQGPSDWADLKKGLLEFLHVYGISSRLFFWADHQWLVTDGNLTTKKPCKTLQKGCWGLPLKKLCHLQSMLSFCQVNTYYI